VPGEADNDLVETLVRWAARLGLNPTRVRWKLTRMPRLWAWLAGLRSGVLLLAIAMLVVFVRMYLFDRDLLDLGATTLTRFGALVPGAARTDDWWRLAAALFVHKGIWHLGLFVVALLFVGREVEALFGRGRTLAIFFVLGGLGNLVSAWLEPGSVSAGSSAGTMALVGVAAAWGHREGARLGQKVRNRMLKWIGYFVIFGLLVRADQVAQVAALLAGGLLGGAIPWGWWTARSPVRDTLLGMTFAAITVATFGLVVSSRAPESEPSSPPPICRERPTSD
jgi:membrane associated rhomboid family serine protease